MTPPDKDESHRPFRVVSDETVDPSFSGNWATTTVESTLAEGTVGFPVLNGWALTERSFTHSIFDIPEIDGATVLFAVECFEDAEAIAKDDLGRYLERVHPDDASNKDRKFDRPEGPDGPADWSGMLLHRKFQRIDQNTGEQFADAHVWRRISPMAGKYIRALTVTLCFPLVDETRPEFEENTRKSVVETVQGCALSAWFSDDLSPLDSLAETSELAPRWFENVAAIRLPKDWPADPERLPKGHELVCFEDLENDFWTLWVEVQTTRQAVPDPAEYILQCLKETVQVGAEQGPLQEADIFLDSDDPRKGYTRITQPYQEDGRKLHHTAWAILAYSGDMLVTVMVHWYVLEDAACQARVKALTDIVEAEIPDALVLPALAAAIFA